MVNKYCIPKFRTELSNSVYPVGISAMHGKWCRAIPPSGWSTSQEISMDTRASKRPRLCSASWFCRLPAEILSAWHRLLISHRDSCTRCLSMFFVWCKPADKNLLKEWNSQTKLSLTQQTARAVHQTCTALVELAKHILLDREFEYVLLGQLQSDVIEQCFGCYRQLSGANYFVSVRQVLEAEKSIRVRSLIKFSDMNINKAKSAMAEAGQQRRPLYSYRPGVHLLYLYLELLPDTGCSRVTAASGLRLHSENPHGRQQALLQNLPGPLQTGPLVRRGP